MSISASQLPKTRQLLKVSTDYCRRVTLHHPYTSYIICVKCRYIFFKIKNIDNVCEIIGPVRMEFVRIFSLARNLGSISLWNFIHMYEIMPGSCTIDCTLWYGDQITYQCRHKMSTIKLLYNIHESRKMNGKIISFRLFVFL